MLSPDSLIDKKRCILQAKQNMVMLAEVGKDSSLLCCYQAGIWQTTPLLVACSWQPSLNKNETVATKIAHE